MYSTKCLDCDLMFSRRDNMLRNHGMKHAQGTKLSGTYPSPPHGRMPTPPPSPLQERIALPPPPRLEEKVTHQPNTDIILEKNEPECTVLHHPFTMMTAGPTDKSLSSINIIIKHSETARRDNILRHHGMKHGQGTKLSGANPLPPHGGMPPPPLQEGIPLPPPPSQDEKVTHQPNTDINLGRIEPEIITMLQHHNDCRSNRYVFVDYQPNSKTKLKKYPL